MPLGSSAPLRILADLMYHSRWGPKGLMLKDPVNFRVTVMRGENPRDFIPKLYGGRAPDGY
jgi:hypothetical protein